MKNSRTFHDTDGHEKMFIQMKKIKYFGIILPSKLHAHYLPKNLSALQAFLHPNLPVLDACLHVYTSCKHSFINLFPHVSKKNLKSNESIKIILIFVRIEMVVNPFLV